eukprot:547621-Prorocentrum_lima.AAC.1
MDAPMQKICGSFSQQKILCLRSSILAPCRRSANLRRRRAGHADKKACLLYTSPSPRDSTSS